ncbi:hypothetical protein PGIGA_G00061860 [Pangasianodon gigas]|uniref:Uncharacterized protein n=1 Tax=Pangasianodon gigas TaxID=30993 RepID=A0ACC5X5J5_PANGG|nr:hypothetical protein [Pangasianodon gigas]
MEPKVEHPGFKGPPEHHDKVFTDLILFRSDYKVFTPSTADNGSDVAEMKKIQNLTSTTNAGIKTVQ